MPILFLAAWSERSQIADHWKETYFCLEFVNTFIACPVEARDFLLSQPDAFRYMASTYSLMAAPLTSAH